jgi:hypothetical protein
MKTRADFARELARKRLSHTDRAVALLWYYRHTQEYEERSAGELATDLHDEGFPRPNVTRLTAELRRNQSTARGKRPGTFQIDVRRLERLEAEYLPLLGIRHVQVAGAVLPVDVVAETRRYLERLAFQINGTYESGFFDASAVLCRRLMESLIIEVYIQRRRHEEIRHNNYFISLDRLINHVKNDRSIPLGRTTGGTMDDVKHLGDTAAHDRTYLTTQTDIDDLKLRYRKMIVELLEISGLRG